MRCACVCLLLAGLSGPMALAGEYEVSLSLGMGFPGKKNIYEAPLTGEPRYTLQTKGSGSQNLVGLNGAYEIFKRERTKFWLTGSVQSAFGSNDYSHFGMKYLESTNAFEMQTMNGKAKYMGLGVGMAMTHTTAQLGEYGLGVEFRNHRVKVTGDLHTLASPPLTETAQGYSDTSSAVDVYLNFSVAFVQNHPTFKTLQRISFGVGLGSGYGDVGPASTSWRLSEAHLERLRPSSEIKFAFGIRL